MRKSLLNKIIFSFFILFFSLPLCAYEIDISADELEYNRNSETLSAVGNVTVIWEGKTVKAHYIEFLIEEKVMTANGNIEITEGGNTVFADKITYYFDEEKGEIKETMAYASVIFIRSNKMNRIDKDTYSVNNIKISNCDLDNPHTCFKAKKGKITLGKRVTIYNPILYVGKVPILYLPILTKSLKGGKTISSRLIYEIEPGFTSEGGISLKNSLIYGFTDNFVGRAMFDYYGSRGWGYGTQFNYSSKSAKASLYAYNINDYYAGMERWTVRPYYWHRLSKRWTVQSQAELISDKEFNNYYNQSDWNRDMSTLNSYLSLTRQGAASNLMIIAQRYDKYNNISGNYEPVSITLPRVNLTYYPKKIFFGISNNFDISYKNEYREYTYGTDHFFYKNIASLNYNITKDLRFGRKFTLKPSLGLNEEYYDKNNSGDMDHSLITRYLASLNSRLRVNRWMDWNINYSFKARSQKNSIEVDSQKNDYGIESNMLSFTNYMYIGNRTTLRNYFSYSFLKNRVSEPQKWSPFVSELIITPKYYIMAYIRQSQLLDPFKFQSMQIDISIGELEKAYFNFGTFYQDYRANEIDNTIGFGLWINPKWRLDYNIRTTAKTDGTYIKMNEHELKLYRDLHCYNLGMTWRIRGIYHEVFFKFDMKTNMPFSKTSQGSQSTSEEQIFYPWR